MYVLMYMYFPTDNTYFISNFQLLQTGLLLMFLLVIHFWSASYQASTEATILLTQPTKGNNGTTSTLIKSSFFFNIKILSAFHAVHTRGCFRHKGAY